MPFSRERQGDSTSDPSCSVSECDEFEDKLTECVQLRTAYIKSRKVQLLRVRKVMHARLCTA